MPNKILSLAVFNNRDYTLELVASLSDESNVVFSLRTYRKGENPMNGRSYAPKLRDFKTLALLLLGLSTINGQASFYGEGHENYK